MLRHALRSSSPNNVVIFQTATMPSVQFFPLGYFVTMPASHDRFSLDYLRGFTEYALLLLRADTLLNIARDVLEPPEKTFPIVNDYMQQNPVRVRVPSDAQFSAPLNEEQIKYLKEIAATCRTHRLNCIYAVGPISEILCRNSGSYLAASIGTIQRSGLQVAAGTPICAPNEHLGDGWEHVAPEAKSIYTTRYFEILRPYLR
jgi:hypothetical protein